MIVSIENPKEPTISPKPNKWVQQCREYKINRKDYVIPLTTIQRNKILRFKCNKTCVGLMCLKLQNSHERNKKFTWKSWRANWVGGLECSKTKYVTSPLMLCLMPFCLDASEICSRDRRGNAKELELKF